MRKKFEVMDDWHEDSDDIYSNTKVIEMMDDDEISPEEAGFMMGYTAG
jgi:hypothetical protein